MAKNRQTRRPFSRKSTARFPAGPGGGVYMVRSKWTGLIAHSKSQQVWTGSGHMRAPPSNKRCLEMNLMNRWIFSHSDAAQCMVHIWPCNAGEFLPSATVVAERLCFQRHLWFCWQWGMCGRGCVWQGAYCRGACMARACVAGGCVAGGRRDGHCSRQYASYWNAFLYISKYETIPTYGLSF